jgi:hypothetical protein
MIEKKKMERILLNESVVFGGIGEKLAINNNQQTMKDVHCVIL